jgi:hypothetical protein
MEGNMTDMASRAHEPSDVEYAEVLFATPLQESDNPGTTQVRAAVLRCIAGHGDDLGWFAERLAQEAGDHPAEAACRMRWALATVRGAFHEGNLALAG